MPHALLEHLDHVCHQALQHTSTQPRQLRDISNAFDILKHQENTSCPWLETAVEYGVLSRWLQRDLPSAPTKRPPVRVGLLHGLSRHAYQLCLSRDIDRRIAAAAVRTSSWWRLGRQGKGSIHLVRP